MRIRKTKRRAYQVGGGRTRRDGDGISSKSSAEYMKRRTRHMNKTLRIQHIQSTL